MMPSKPRKIPPRQRLLDTACRMFYDQGIGATGIDRLLAEAGVAKMSLYKTFGSKDALVLEYLRQRYGGFVPALRATLEERHAHTADRILGLFDVLDEWFRDPGFRGCPLLNAAVEISLPTHPARETAANLVGEFHRYLEELCQAAGSPQPSVLAEQLCLLTYGAIACSQLSRSPDSASSAKAIAKELLAGIGLMAERDAD